jgi:hypothetical protein
MKKRLLFFGLFGCSLAFGQQNQSLLNVAPTLTAGQEIFRFQPGFTGQLQNATSYSTNPTDRWFSIGQVTQGGQTFYGQRFQYDGRALVTGYTNNSPSNPRIEWIHSGGSSAGNLEFRVANSFTGGLSKLVASMTPETNTYFALNTTPFNTISPKVGILFNDKPGLYMVSDGVITSTNPLGQFVSLQHNANNANGILCSVSGGETSIAITGKAFGAANSIGVYGITPSNTQFAASIYGVQSVSNPFSLFAGYFDGDVQAGTMYIPSDAKLKENIKDEISALYKIMLLNPVTYNYKKVDGLCLSQLNQHGFISQELAEVFPELTKDITKPVFDEEGKVVSELSYKTINYIGLISVLTESVQELNTELIKVRQDLDDYKANDAIRSQIVQNTPNLNGYSIEQNVPNPFSDKTSIRFQLAPGVQSATLSIFNLNGAFVRDYSLEGNSGEIEILASEIGKGMFIYSLNQNGQEIISKRMIVK